VTGNSGPLGSSDYYTAKYAAANGALLWQRWYSFGPNDVPYAIAVDSVGNVVVTGSSRGFRGADYATIKYAASDGSQVWVIRYDGPARTNDVPNAVAVDSSGDVIVTGSSAGFFNSRTNSDIYTAKYASGNGALIWERRFNGPGNADDGANALAVDSNGDVVIAGYAGWTNVNGYAAKYAASDGSLIWGKYFTNGRLNGVAVDGNNNVVVTGYSSNGTNDDYYTAKYAADGTLLWEQRYNSSANRQDQAFAVKIDAQGNAIITGTSHNGNNDDYYTAKYAGGNGSLLWEARYNGPANGPDVMLTKSSLAIGPNGMMAITGSSDGNFLPATTISEYATVVYFDPVSPVSIEKVPGYVRITFTGSPGYSYEIERAPEVSGPWNVIAARNTPIDTLIGYIDTNAPPGQAFYRVSRR